MNRSKETNPLLGIFAGMILKTLQTTQDKLKYHVKYFCGPDAERTEKQQMTDKKSALKSEAVKRMKIGGKETEIVLNPLTALRPSCPMDSFLVCLVVILLNFPGFFLVVLVFPSFF